MSRAKLSGIILAVLTALAVWSDAVQLRSRNRLAELAASGNIAELDAEWTRFGKLGRWFVRRDKLAEIGRLIARVREDNAESELSEVIGNIGDLPFSFGEENE